MSLVQCYRRLPRVILTWSSWKPLPSSIHSLHTSSRQYTDGVYTALTEMCVKTPWIEVLRRQNEATVDSRENLDTPVSSSNRDLRPKKMSDSYHSVVQVS